MKAPNLVQFFAQIGLQLQLWLARCGWSNSVAVLVLALGCGAWLWAVPHLNAQMAATQGMLHRTQKTLDNAPLTPPIPALPLAEQRLQHFYDALGESRYAEQQIKTLFAIAAKRGLRLNLAEYKFAYDKSGRFHTYAILLPVKGSYAAIRPFCEQVLLAIPFASLDEVNFKRETITNPTLEAKLHFTLHLDGSDGFGDGAAASAGKPSTEL